MSHGQFTGLFAADNEPIWPAQILAYLLRLLILAAVLRQRGAESLAAFVALAAMWAWTGAANHWLHFAQINPAAWLFGALYVMEAVILAMVAKRLGLARPAVPRRALGIALIVYSMLLYPLVKRS